MSDKLIFTVKKTPEGGYTAQTSDGSIVTEAHDLPALREAVRDAVRSNFDPADRPASVTLHYESTKPAGMSDKQPAPVPTRGEIHPGTRVSIVEKQNQPTGIRSEGIVARLLTKSPVHPRGIKVMLTDGRVGRVQEII